ncbi:L-threonine 3-dehydrogenase [Maioricimonas rarisocia]|uniref:alcohol dehydrogenase n=1 Tax=Maioricimonas rarisocia TaxID=2528026 RepID=A0A517Z3F2_9PLAN|nr:zinc-binding dehydrogenase [Maioricimonas rarisocia]QDU36957.1 L-threonine 3-dehydrogenase [Maioricimonas rarisocia]
MTSLPDSALAAVFHAPGRPFELSRISLPTLEPGEAIVRIECCTVCGSDLHSITGRREVPVPTILGHEMIGTIAAVGPGNPLQDLDGEPLQPGDRVAWSVAASCGSCTPCQRGLSQKCRRLIKYGHQRLQGRHQLAGGLAEYCHLVRGTAVVRLDPSVSADVLGPVGCATSTVAAVLRAAGDIADRRVLVIGAGALGLTAAAMAQWQGASHVAVCDVNPDRLERARGFGADQLIPWEAAADLATPAPENGFDAILELAGAPDAIELAPSLLNVGGTLVLAGTVFPTRPVSLDPEQIVRGLFRIAGVHNYVPADLQQAVRFLTECHQRFPLADFVERTFPLGEIDAAIASAIDTRPCRIAIRPGE